MAYIPWWQRYEAPTFAERFELGGLAGQQLVKKTDELRPGFAGVTKNIKNVEDVPYLKTAESGTGKKFYLVSMSTQNTEAGPGLKRRFPLTKEGKAEAIKAINEHKKKYPNIFKRENIFVGKDGVVRYQKRGEPIKLYDPKKYGSLEKAMEAAKKDAAASVANKGDANRKKIDMKKVIEMKDKGMSNVVIGKEFNVDERTISQRLKDIDYKPGKVFKTTEVAINNQLKILKDNNYIKKILSNPNHKYNKKDIEVVMKLLNVTPKDAQRRLLQLANAITGDREMPKDFKLSKVFNVKAANNMINELPYSQSIRDLEELKVGKTFDDKSIKATKAEIRGNKNYIFSESYSIDEPSGVRSGSQRGTHPYSIFGQVIKTDINKGAKYQWDAIKSIKEKNLQKALEGKLFDKKGNKISPAQAVADFNKAANKYEKILNEGKGKGQPKIKLFRISTDGPKNTIKNFNKYSDKYKNVFLNNYKNKGYSFVVPKDIKTIPEIKKAINNVKDVKKMTSLFKAGSNRLFSVADPLLWGFVVDDVLKKQAKGKTVAESIGSAVFLDKPIRKGLKRLKATDEQNLAYDRQKNIEYIQSGNASGQDLYHMARKDPDFDGNYTQYLEFLKEITNDAGHRMLLSKRDSETEQALTIPEEKVKSRSETYQMFNQIPLVQAVKELFKTDEQKAKDLENLLNV
jgi:hypothetical protein